MPKKLIQIGEAPQLPTVAEYFREMAAQQGEDIQRLKAEAEARTGLKPKRSAKNPRRKSARKPLTPEPWQLHPRKKR